MSSGYNQYTNSIRTKIVRDAVEANPTMPARTLARHLLVQHPAHFPNLNAARCSVSYMFGKASKARREYAAVQRPERKAGEDWKQYLPEERRTIAEPWGLFEIKGTCRALILSDVHVPFYDADALKIAIEYGMNLKSNLIIINGDMMDCLVLSRFATNPQLRDFPGEVRDGRAMLKAMRAAFPNARIIWKWGNHEERYETRLRAYPEFYGVDDWQWPSVFRLKDHGVELVRDKRPIMLGKLAIIHGHEYGQGFTDPVSPARTFFLKAGVNVLGGHYHRTSQHSKKDLRQTVVSAWSTGCLCEKYPDWKPLNDWNSGFAFVDVNKDGGFRVENLRIIDGKAW